METEQQHIEAVLNKFLIVHKDGIIRRRWVYGRTKRTSNGMQKYIPGHYNSSSPLTNEEISALSAYINNDAKKFEQLLDQHQPFKDQLQGYVDKLTKQLFAGIYQLKRMRNNEERRRIAKEQAQLAKRQKQEASKLERLRQKEEQKSKQLEARAKLKLERSIKLRQQREEAKRLQQKAKAKGQKRAALWKELQLSAEQKKVFKKLATV